MRLGRNRLMRIAALPLKLLGSIRRRRAARPKRSMEDWIALAIARGLSLAVVGGLDYVTYMVEMTGFDDFRKCNKASTITRFEWVLGFRPAEGLQAVGDTGRLLSALGMSMRQLTPALGTAHARFPAPHDPAGSRQARRAAPRSEQEPFQRAASLFPDCQWTGARRSELALLDHPSGQSDN